MKEKLIETIETREVEARIEKDVEPTAEVVGKMSEIMRGKWRGVEQVFHF